MKTLDYINVRDAQVHGLVNPTFIMYGNCSLKDYSFEVTVDGKKREARFLPDLASDNYELKREDTPSKLSTVGQLHAV